MAATSPIGNVTTIILKTYDQLQNKYETNISKGFTVNPVATYQNLNIAVRSLAGLTTNTYEDTTLVTEISLNEEIAE